MIPIDALASELAALCRRHHVRELAVFGSAARGDARPDSDIDLLVEFEPSAQIGFIALARLAHELEALFGRKVDLVPKDGLKARIRDHVLAEAEVIFAA
ncbi:Nucleotidyltransferase domain protein [Phycisphaerae bacterium RAS1]|nr:Nucleotidyltransferase domain protein [Phycisphaerae bacterium RAS1]